MKKFNLKEHRELWNWLADNPGSMKNEWPGWHGRIITPIHFCFACEAGKYRDLMNRADISSAKIQINCELNCPIFTKPCFNEGELFSVWIDALGEGELDKSVETAKMIRDLPLKPGWIEE